MLEMAVYWHLCMIFVVILAVFRPMVALVFVLIMDMVAWYLDYESAFSRFFLRRVRSMYPLRIHGDKYEKQAIYVYHPHGIVCMGAQMVFCVDPVFSNRPSLLANPFLFRVPIMRGVLRGFGCNPATMGECERILGEGGSYSICGGGSEESVMSGWSPMRIRMKRRRSHFMLSRRYDVPIVPVICPGENEIMRKWDHPLENFLVWALGFNVPVVGLPKWMELDVYVGNPVWPGDDQKERLMSEIKRITPCEVEFC
jgi:hypothetical protein